MPTSHGRPGPRLIQIKADQSKRGSVVCSRPVRAEVSGFSGSFARECAVEWWQSDGPFVEYLRAPNTRTASRSDRRHRRACRAPRHRRSQRYYDAVFRITMPPVRHAAISAWHQPGSDAFLAQRTATQARGVFGPFLARTLTDTRINEALCRPHPQTREDAGADLCSRPAAKSLFRQARPVLRLRHPENSVSRLPLCELSA